MRRRTWNWFADRRRAPSEYEELTVGLQWNSDPVVQTDVGSWSLESTAIKDVDWESFRDPAKLYYRNYVTLQNTAENELDGILGVGVRAVDPAALSDEWRRCFADMVAGMAFAEWATAMVNQHIQRFCLSSTLAAAMQLQVVDKFRRAERLLEWTGTVLGEPTETSDPARVAWMTSSALQPLRRYLEQALTVEDWGEAIVAVNIALDGQLQPFLHRMYQQGGKASGDFVTVGLGDAFEVDTARHMAANRAALELALTGSEVNVKVLRGWLEHWGPAAAEAVAALAGGHPLDGIAQTALADAKTVHAEFLAGIGEGALTGAVATA